LRGEVIHIDHFGNISSSIMREDVGGREIRQVRVGSWVVKDVVNTFGERPPGTLVALYGSTDNLLVCEVNGNAAERLKVRVGEVFEVQWAEG
jgi:hypothetical protein